jgi:hypothetical protein
MAMNLAEKFESKVDERFTAQSYAVGVTGNNFSFDGVETVNVYDMPIAPLHDYDRSRAMSNSRYGDLVDLQASVQKMKVEQDKSFTFGIDRKDLIMSQMVMEANKALRRQIDQSIVPAYDNHVFKTLAAKASALGNMAKATPTKSNAYELFLQGQEFLGDHLAPTEGRMALCSYKFANLIKQDPSFVRYGDMSQKMLSKGVIGSIDGVSIKQVPSSLLPNGCSCILTHPYASVAPKRLEDYKIHDNPVGYSGYVVEGRFIYDCFILNNKANGIFYIGNSGVLRTLNVVTAPSVTVGKTRVIVSPEADSGNTWYYKTGTTITDVVFGTAITTSGWTKLDASGVEITPTSSHTLIQVVEVDSESKPVGHGIARLNIG